MPMILLENIKKAAGIIKGNVIRTPLIHSPTLSRMFGASVYLKLENLQKTGSFKIRGATYKIHRMSKEIGSGGVVAASAGNHAQGVALAAAQAGIPATIVMPEWVSISKQEATRSYGGRVLIQGENLAASLELAQEIGRENMTFIHPFDDVDIITGQGTIALEIFEDLPDVDMIIAPIGGGGLISGIASAVRSLNPDIRIIGVQSAACPSAHESLRKGSVQVVDAQSSIADGITVKQPGKLTFDIIRECIDQVALVEEEHIASAILMLLERKKILAEGAGAVCLAALLNGSIKLSGDQKVVLVISGGNVDSPLLGRIIGQGLTRNGRIMRLQVKLEDMPGALSGLLTLIASLEANVLDIHHDRYMKDVPLYVSYVELELETRSFDHVDEIAEALKRHRYDIELK